MSGSNLSVKALVRNISGQDIFLVTDPDGSIADRYYRLDTTVSPNNAGFHRFLANSGPRVIHTIAPGATLEAFLNKKALGFTADYLFPRTYSFHLTYSATSDWENDLAESNILPIDAGQPPSGGPAPLLATLSGPEKVAAGDPVRLDLALKNMANFEFVVPIGQMNLLQYPFSVRDQTGREMQMKPDGGIASQPGEGRIPYKALREQPGALPAVGQGTSIKGSNMITAIQPGDTVRSYAVISQFYDLSQPGTYRVQWNYPTSAQSTSNPVASNVLEIQVTAQARR